MSTASRKYEVVSDSVAGAKVGATFVTTDPAEARWLVRAGHIWPLDKAGKRLTPKESAVLHDPANEGKF